MNWVCLTLGAIFLALIAATATAIAILCRPPQCPLCKSPDVDEFPCHCICRICGSRWEEPKRFGSHGGCDL